MKNSKISIIICTRNSAKTIRLVLDSIVLQAKIKAIEEVIIVDYLSSDDTLKIINDSIRSFPIIKFVLLNCLAPGKAPALIMGLNYTNADAAVIVDDDNILDPYFVTNILPILTEPNIGLIGTNGIADNNLILPDWFNDFSGCYAVGCVPDKPFVTWVWGAGCVITMKAWEALKIRGYSFILNPAREDNSVPISIGGEDVELALAIRLIGFELRVCSSAKYIHAFPQSRLTTNYLIKNARGVSRSTAVHTIYRILISQKKLLYPKFNFNLLFFRNLLGNLRLLIYYLITFNFLKVKYYLAVIIGQLEGYLIFKNRFNVIYEELSKLKYKSHK